MQDVVSLNPIDGTKYYFSHYSLLEWNVKNLFCKTNIKLLKLSYYLTTNQNNNSIKISRILNTNCHWRYSSLKLKYLYDKKINGNKPTATSMLKWLELKSLNGIQKLFHCSTWYA